MDILFKDNDIIICVKPSGVVSTDEEGGMPQLLRQALGNKEADIRAVHRLDMVVGGLMVYARNQNAAAKLSRQITENTFRKEYLAVVHGAPEQDEGRMEDLLFRNAAENKTYVVKRMRKGVREAALEYQVLAKKDGLSLVKIHLLTGRTHQIRAQFSSRGMPLAGDRKYGAAEDRCETALWSCRLCFSHPKTGKTMDYSLNPSGGWPWNEFGFTGAPVESVRQIPETAPAPAAQDHAESTKCPYAKKCGGCQLQNMTYEQQLAWKQKHERILLDKFAKVEPIIGMEDPTHYRNKVQAAFGRTARGKIISGVYQSNSHRIVAVDSCMIEDRIADSIITDIRKLLPDFKIKVYDEDNDTGFLRHVLVKRGFTSGEVMVVLVGSSPIFPMKKQLTAKLLQLHPEITTVVFNINPYQTNLVLGDREEVLYGDGTIEDTLCGCVFRISPRSFYQINPVQTEILYGKAMEYAQLDANTSVIDAYCGIGTIGLVAAKTAGSVIGVELNPDAVKDAISNAKRNNARNARFYCGDAGEYMEALASEGKRADVVFMDPPRAGSSVQFINAMTRMAPRRIVYISCNPETLARDLELITRKGYKVQKICPVDMFPHTQHVETVVLMARIGL